MASSDIHVLPLNDIKPHVEGEDCPCDPEVIEEYGSDKIIVHNSWDRREISEQAIEAIEENEGKV